MKAEREDAEGGTFEEARGEGGGGVTQNLDKARYRNCGRNTIPPITHPRAALDRALRCRARHVIKRHPRSLDYA